MSYLHNLYALSIKRFAKFNTAIKIEHAPEIFKK